MRGLRKGFGTGLSNTARGMIEYSRGAIEYSRGAIDRLIHIGSLDCFLFLMQIQIS